MSTQVAVPVRKQIPAAERAVSVSSHVVLSIWAILVIVPLLWTLMTSFKTT
jgi:N-acetylglucosamine transport system permease protein